MRRACFLALWATLTMPARAQVATEANSSYESPEGRQRMIRLLSAPERAGNVKAEELVARLGLKPGDTVVDLGTGAGVLLPYLSTAVGEAGTVIAQDIHTDILDAALENATKAGLVNVQYVLGTARRPDLPPGAANVIVCVDAYHHFNYPTEMLAGIRAALKDAGRFVVVEYYKAGFRDPDHIRADKPEVIQEIQDAGFRLVEDREHVPGSQYMLIFSAAGTAR